MGICHWDRGLITAPETPEKIPAFVGEVPVGKGGAYISTPLLVIMCFLFGASLHLNMGATVSSL